MEFLRRYRYPLVILLHIFLIAISYYLSFLLRFDFSIKGYTYVILKTLPVLIIIKVLVFYYFGVFNSSLKYVSVFDLWQILKANFFATTIFVLFVVFLHGIIGFPRSIFILDWGICLGLTGGVRLVARVFRERVGFSKQKKTKRVLIIGAGEAGILVLRECRRNPHINLNIIGFIDDSPAKRNLRIHGVKVLGTRKDIPFIVEKYQVEEIIIAIPSAKGEVIRDIISCCQIPEVKIKIVPSLHKIISGELEIKLREVRPEDLLGRETVKIDEKEVSSYIKGKCVLITGAGGSIGSELTRQVASFLPSQLILLDYNENDVYFLSVELRQRYPQVSFKEIIGDVKDISLLKHIFSKFRPQIVFHSAAFKHVPLMETNPSSAVKNNIISTRNLIYASEHYGVESFVFISTDKAVNPTSIMGATKRIAEMLLQAKAKRSRTKFMAVRFGNVLGSKGSVVPLFKKQIEEGGPVTVTHPEAERYFMSVKEAVELVLQASAMGKGGEVFILDMGQPIKILDLAKDLITLSGLKPYTDIPIEFIGLRAGEKLSEELFLNIEKDKATKHNKIYIAQPDEFNPSLLRRKIKELERLSNLMAEDKIIEKIKEILPHYNNSFR
ncbi:MAG: polysaccharide biosynthesis protein [Candidatus Duberdicusella sinuisediminis]|nr:MAG: polysaccharide biosynthesis protein [Candidatus Omnitrophota bacterium]